MSKFNFFDHLLPGPGKDEDDNMWNGPPDIQAIVLYSVITPIICTVGIVGNGLSCLVLKRREFKGSVYIYLEALAISDFFAAIILFMGGLSKGDLWSDEWCSYIEMINIPLEGFFNCLGVMAIVGVTIDRVIYLWNPMQIKKPQYCRKQNAKFIMYMSGIASFIFNLPYYFIFTWGKNGEIKTTPFFDSLVYQIFNWVYICLFAIIPAIVLIIGNGYLIRFLHKSMQMDHKMRKQKRLARKETLIVTLVLMIICFLVSEIPANLTSRTATINVLFEGDSERAAQDGTVELLRQICSVIVSINVTTNFLLFCCFCPTYCQALTKQIKCQSNKRRPSKVQLNVFVVQNPNFDLVEKQNLRKFSVKMLKIARQSIPSVVLPLENDCSSSSSSSDSEESSSSTKDKFTTIQ